MTAENDRRYTAHGLWIQQLIAVRSGRLHPLSFEKGVLQKCLFRMRKRPLTISVHVVARHVPETIADRVVLKSRELPDLSHPRVHHPATDTILRHGQTLNGILPSTAENKHIMQLLLQRQLELRLALVYVELS